MAMDFGRREIDRRCRFLSKKDGAMETFFIMRGKDQKEYMAFFIYFRTSIAGVVNIT
jgi:hypothetical protein